MRIMHRIIHHITPDKWGEVMEWEAKFKEFDEKYGAPPFHWYRAMIGAETTDTLIGEREWESLAQIEIVSEKLGADLDRQKLEADSQVIFLDTRYEFYAVLGPA